MKELLGGLKVVSKKAADQLEDQIDNYKGQGTDFAKVGLSKMKDYAEDGLVVTKRGMLQTKEIISEQVGKLDEKKQKEMLEKMRQVRKEL